jgi:hypothetical protein
MAFLSLSEANQELPGRRRREAVASKAAFFRLFKIISSILQRGSEDPPVRHGSGSYGAADALEFYDVVGVYTIFTYDVENH